MPRAARLRPTRRARHLTFPAIEVIGGLLTPDIVARIAEPSGDAATRNAYGIPEELDLRDEIARAFRMAEAQWSRFDDGHEANPALAYTFAPAFLKSVFGFDDLLPVPPARLGERIFPIGHAAGGGRVPVVVAPAVDPGRQRTGLDVPHETFADGGRRRSATQLLQEYLNAEDACRWGIATDGRTLRLMRDNLSLTRPAYIEVDLAKIVRDGLYPDFSALWLLIHRSRFGAAPASMSDCPLERWREQGKQEGVAARDNLRAGVEAALALLGQGAIEHRDNAALRDALAFGRLSPQGFYEELLGAVYRLIFLFAAEDRNLLHPPETPEAARRAYAAGYGIGRLRERAVHRTSWNRHHDAWDGLRAVFRALVRGAATIGLPGLGGLFDPGRAPNLDAARIGNRPLMEAIWRLAWIRPPGQSLARVNWRDMETEELGSVYEGLLELIPEVNVEARTFKFAEGGQTRGNARKNSGSYYTPDGLVQSLLDSALDPVLDEAEARNPGDPAAEILKLSIIDPACGSGHFLLGAARRAATRIVRARSPGAPSQEEFQHALREVVSHCIYGVDRNPMAVDLCKVALWIEALEPGKPLTFLDSHIRSGDSLIGVFDLNVLREGIPKDAFKPQPGHEKDAASHYRAKNKKEIQERESAEAGFDLSVRQTTISKAFARLQTGREDSLADIEAKRLLFESLIAQGGDAWRLRIACDLWTAAWFAPKTEIPQRGRELVPTSGQVWEYLRGVTIYGPLIAEADRCAHTHNFFHWPVEFPDIMARGGFDVVIGNPPWERVEVQEQEFFATGHPEIANAQNAAKRKRMIEGLAEADPRAFSGWQDALRTAATEVSFYKSSGRFPFGSNGKINTYAIFADHFRQCMSRKGRSGLILPTGLVAGFTYRDFLAHLLQTQMLASFYGFENEDLLFQHITNKVKFGLLTLTGVDRPIKQPWFTAHIRQPDEISDSQKRYALTIDEIEAINPNTLNLPAFRCAKDAEVTAAIHKASPVLVRKHADGREENPWQAVFRTLFNMATDSVHFLDHEDIAPLIVERRGALAVLEDGREVYPLYEGKMFWHFDHRYGTYEGQTEKQANKGVLPRVPDDWHDDPVYRIEPRYWVEAGLTHDALGDQSTRDWYFAWRDVGPSERTLVGTIVPKTALGHASPIILSNLSAQEKTALFAILSTIVVDYAIRQKTNRMTFFILEQSPIIPRNALLTDINWLGAKAIEWINLRALELFYSNEELEAFAADLGRHHPPFRWNPERRMWLQAEIDAAVLHLYGLDRAQAEWLLDSFTVLRKYEERDHGEFRTKRVILDVFDDMAAAKRSGGVYRTRLDPPPADPRCCHGADALEGVT